MALFEMASPRFLGWLSSQSLTCAPGHPTSLPLSRRYLGGVCPQSVLMNKRWAFAMISLRVGWAVSK
jgi:hypothetical protein